MTAELKAFYRLQAITAAAFNFFISAMITGLLYHKADAVPIDTISLAVDILITALITSVITAFFMRAAVMQTNTRSILPPRNKTFAALSRLFERPGRLGITLGIGIAVVLMCLILPLSVLSGVERVSFWGYVPVKALFCSLLGATITLTALYIGMCKSEK